MLLSVSVLELQRCVRCGRQDRRQTRPGMASRDRPGPRHLGQGTWAPAWTSTRAIAPSCHVLSTVTRRHSHASRIREQRLFMRVLTTGQVNNSRLLVPSAWTRKHSKLRGEAVTTSAALSSSATFTSAPPTDLHRASGLTPVPTVQGADVSDVLCAPRRRSPPPEDKTSAVHGAPRTARVSPTEHATCACGTVAHGLPE